MLAERCRLVAAETRREPRLVAAPRAHLAFFFQQFQRSSQNDQDIIALVIAQREFAHLKFNVRVSREIRRSARNFCVCWWDQIAEHFAPGNLGQQLIDGIGQRLKLFALNPQPGCPAARARKQAKAAPPRPANGFGIQKVYSPKIIRFSTHNPPAHPFGVFCAGEEIRPKLIALSFPFLLFRKPLD